MTTVSAVLSTSGPCSTVTVKSASVRTGRPSTLQVDHLVPAVGRAEDPAGDAQFEGIDAVEGQDHDPMHDAWHDPIE